MSADLYAFKLGLLILWGSWFSLVVLSNLSDAFKVMGALPSRWLFDSRNYQRLREAVEVYCLPAWTAAWLYASVIAWQTVAAVLFWRALAASLDVDQVALGPSDLAFTCALALWGAFMLAEEIFKQYRTEGKHLLFFSAQLLSLGALHVLPG